MSFRPSSVLAVGIVLCFLGAIGMLAMLGSIPGTDVMPVWMSSDEVKAYNIDMWSRIIAAVGTLVCGIFILQGENWARWAYATLCLALLAYTAFYAAGELVALVPALVVRIICVVVLFLPNANEYFTRRPHRWDD